MEKERKQEREKWVGAKRLENLMESSVSNNSCDVLQSEVEKGKIGTENAFSSCAFFSARWYKLFFLFPWRT